MATMDWRVAHQQVDVVWLYGAKVWMRQVRSSGHGACSQFPEAAAPVSLFITASGVGPLWMWGGVKGWHFYTHS